MSEGKRIKEKWEKSKEMREQKRLERKSVLDLNDEAIIEFRNRARVPLPKGVQMTPDQLRQWYSSQCKKEQKKMAKELLGIPTHTSVRDLDDKAIIEYSNLIQAAPSPIGKKYNIGRMPLPEGVDMTPEQLRRWYSLKSMGDQYKMQKELLGKPIKKPKPPPSYLNLTPDQLKRWEKLKVKGRRRFTKQLLQSSFAASSVADFKATPEGSSLIIPENFPRTPKGGRATSKHLSTSLPTLTVPLSTSTPAKPGNGRSFHQSTNGLVKISIRNDLAHDGGGGESGWKNGMEGGLEQTEKRVKTAKWTKEMKREREENGLDAVEGGSELPKKQKTRGRKKQNQAKKEGEKEEQSDVFMDTSLKPSGKVKGKLKKDGSKDAKCLENQKVENEDSVKIEKDESEKVVVPKKRKLRERKNGLVENQRELNLETNKTKKKKLVETRRENTTSETSKTLKNGAPLSSPKKKKKKIKINRQFSSESLQL